jgi:hypothetical protein
MKLQEHLLPYGDAPPDYEPEWLIEGVWQYHGVNFLVGPPKRARKSTLRRYWLACTLMGIKPFGQYEIGRPVKRALVMLVEDHPGNERKVMDAIFRASGHDGLIPKVDFATPIGFSLNNGEHLGQLLNLVEERKYDLVIIDPLIEFHSCDENSASDMRRVALALRALAEKCCVVVIHHSSKPPLQGNMFGSSRTVGESLRGSGVLGGIADTTIRSHAIGTHKHRIKLHFEAKQAEEHDPVELDIDTDTWLIEPVAPLNRDAVLLALQNAGSLSRKELVETLGRRKTDVNRLIRELVEANLIEEVRVRDGDTRSRKFQVVRSGDG